MSYFFVVGLTLFLYVSFCFLLSVVKKRNDIADVAWGIGFVLIAWVAFFIEQSGSVRGLLVNLLVSVWGIRLAFHIYNRNKGHAEDYRYALWRRTWGKWFYLRSYAQVYLLQGALLFLIILPVLLVHKNSSSALGVLDLIGVAVWIFGFIFESVGDAQLKTFLNNHENKGKLMQRGLWQYTRHPNYFGEVAGWWGMWIIALSVPGALLGIIGPITITVLILYVSGIPLLENKMAENPEFQKYKARTSMFFPLPPKK